MWVHKECGGTVESELRYSDATDDYYFLYCSVCKKDVPVTECREVKESEAQDGNSPAYT